MWIHFPLWATLQRNIPRDHLQSYPISVCASRRVKVFSWCLADCYGVSGRLGDMARMALVTWQGDDDDSGKLLSLIQFSIWLTDEGRGRRIAIEEGIGIGKWCVDTIPTVEYLSINGWKGECNSTFIWMATNYFSISIFSPGRFNSTAWSRNLKPCVMIRANLWMTSLNERRNWDGVMLGKLKTLDGNQFATIPKTFTTENVLPLTFEMQEALVRGDQFCSRTVDAGCIREGKIG